MFKRKDKTDPALTVPTGPTELDSEDWLGIESKTSLSKEVAFATILAAAVYADGKVKRAEVQEMMALANRTRTMKAVDEEKRRAAYKTAIESVEKRDRYWDAVSNACAKLLELNKQEAPGITESVYAHACDLIYSDQEVPDSEMQLLARLRTKMQIDNQQAQWIFEEIGKKNFC